MDKIHNTHLIKLLFLFVLIVLLASFSFAETDSIVDANNRFSFNLYSMLSKENSDENVFFSPYSISTALAMTYEGAMGDTAREIQKVFYFPVDNKILREGYLDFINEVNKKDKKYQLNTANALWVEKTYKLLDDYIKTNEKYYQGRATNVGFIDPSEREQTRIMINQWIEEQTKSKIIQHNKTGAIIFIGRVNDPSK